LVNTGTSLQAIKLVLEMGKPGVESKESDQTPLSWAARCRHEEVMKLLLEKSAELESKDDRWGQTPLSWTARGGHEAVVQLLLAKEGVDPNSKDVSGQTPLSWAAWKGHAAVVQLLLAKDGVDPDSTRTRPGL
jgi:ankyrin repeat protein